jgi:4,5-DOPA dioxygenase extradiol
MSEAARLSRRRALALAAGASVAAVATGAHGDNIPRAPPREPPLPAPPPILFVSHGSPRLAIDRARYEPLREWGTSLARATKPRGIVAMTPHFASRRLRIGANGAGRAMHNLPPAIRRQIPESLDYRTPANTPMMVLVERALTGRYALEVDIDRPGFDHTTWIPLSHLFPAADLPVLELSFPYLPDRELFELGRKLGAIRGDGVLFFASGGVTHNLASVDISGGAPAEAIVPAWSKEFDQWTTEIVRSQSWDALIDWRAKAPAQAIAHPDDGAHFRVLLVAAGFASTSTIERVSFPVTGYEATLSVRSIELT